MFKSKAIVLYLAVVAGALAVQAAVLLAMGQPPICACGTVKFWHGVVTSSENSQHLADWYSFSHIIHGFGFYLLLWLVTPRAPLHLRFAGALLLEAGWEIFENMPFIINRYRQSALAQGYVGDSVINSIFDTLFMVLGFWLARILPRPTTLVLFIAMELGVAYMIRDNLLLNIIQLAYPTEAVSRWQSGR